ncbi:hypothetical protein NPIL_613231 [Nephila pilipes]|uniref:Peptidase aspartic putative domain-containing protein n=1 Tax=Nephila pilipes TaxID=299642 RepID=A0A8X6QV68_NEPPI|nr:hypothetical protein NPIL_613231 [Nephila pilipes]
MDEASIKKMRDRAKSNLTSIVNSFSEHLRKSVLLSRMEKLDNVFKDFDHYDAMLREEQWEIEEFEERYFAIKGKYQGVIDALNSSPIVNTSFKTSENCIINELTPRETELIPCNTVQGEDFSFTPTATGHDCAVVLDSGSAATSVSESLVNKQLIERTNACISVKGLGSSESAVTPKYGSDKKYLQIDAFILNKVMSNLPTEQVDVKDLNYLDSTKLADVKFSIPKKIDLANYYFNCLWSEQIIKSVKEPIVQNTVFGWAVLGKMNIKGNASHQFNSYQISLSCDHSIVYPHASSPASRDNSNVVDNNINCTANDETLIRRPARALDSSKNENSRGIEPAPIPSPKCALWYQNPKVIGLSSSHEKTDMPAQQNFSEGASTSSCLFSSPGACVSCSNTSIGDAPFRLCLRFTIFGIKLTVSTTSVAASRNGGTVFERTIALLKQYNLEPDPD